MIEFHKSTVLVKNSLHLNKCNDLLLKFECLRSLLKFLYNCLANGFKTDKTKQIPLNINS